MIRRLATTTLLRQNTGSVLKVASLRHAFCRFIYRHVAKSGNLLLCPLDIRLNTDQRQFSDNSNNMKRDIRDCRKDFGYCEGEEEYNSSMVIQGMESLEVTSKKLMAEMEIVERIVSELRAKGRTFILPVNDATAMNSILEPFKLFSDIGIRSEFVIDACVCTPQLFTSLTQRGETSTQIIELIVDFCQLTYEDAIRIFATYTEELMTVGPEEVQKCMEVLESYGFNEKALGKAVCSCPALLFTQKCSKLAQNAENLSSYFSKKQLYSLLKSSPELLLGSTDETEDKIEYIYCHMLMEGDDFTRCTRLAQISLNELMDRHEFMLKTGVYKTPDVKRPQLKMRNPELRKILDTSAENFATNIAHVSVKEWNLFRELQSKYRTLNADTEVHRFERIKPSMRKQAERRRKLLSPNDSETFESYYSNSY